MDDHPALWVTVDHLPDRLAYRSLNDMLARRAKQAGVTPPHAHDFRRAFALSMLRAGTDVYTLAKLMGHSGITVLQRYLKQTDADTRLAHLRNSPVDGLDHLK